ncbi:hypothetical protein [Streptomyces angustmyceticus]|uniref:hypothetical protein n=1 Tax=Streptomyces angustmyceticus TaxID=285578 RepID=UPI00344E8FCD
MDTMLSPAARQVARFWAQGHDRSACVVRGYARQVQDHLDHGADPDYLRRVAGWMSLERPECLDIDMALRFAAAPRPDVTTRTLHACVCRGGSARSGGAPAPATLRQLIRRPASRAA